MRLDGRGNCILKKRGLGMKLNLIKEVDVIPGIILCPTFSPRSINCFCLFILSFLCLFHATLGLHDADVVGMVGVQQ